jgi:hypothetical protein
MTHDWTHIIIFGHTQQFLHTFFIKQSDSGEDLLIQNEILGDFNIVL